MAQLNMALLLSVDPAAVQRANRLQYAIDLLQDGKSQAEVGGMLRLRYGVSRVTSWRIARDAADLSQVFVPYRAADL